MCHCLQSSVLQDLWAHKLKGSKMSQFQYILYTSNTRCLGTGQRSLQRRICCMKLTKSFPSAFTITFASQSSVFTEQTMLKIEPQLQ
jgi:hypothetical protein